MKNIIEIKNLKKSFGKKEVLKGIDLNIAKGERVAILGANGAGKTTLVEIIAQTSTQTSGEVKINIEGDIKKEIGVQFQQGDWPGGISAFDMIQFYKKIYPNFDDKRHAELEKVFELEEFVKRPLHKLSGGQKQRFNAMISVMNNPEIIILDELTTGLDMQLQFKILSYFEETVKKQKQTLLIVSHNPEEVEKLCDRLIIIHDGIVWIDDSIANIIKKYKSVRKLMELYFDGGVKHETK